MQQISDSELDTAIHTCISLNNDLMLLMIWSAKIYSPIMKSWIRLCSPCSLLSRESLSTCCWAYSCY